MASVRERTDVSVKAFCDDVYAELAGMRVKLLTVIDELSISYGDEAGNEVQPFKQFHRHLTDLADQIEWKLQILSHACPYDWKGSEERVEKIVSVREPDVSAEPDFSGGYVGG